MHPKHQLLLKKNAQTLTWAEDDPKTRAFYFALDKGSGEEILHIDRKIKAAGKFNNVKKLNRTLEPFGDDDYRLTDKAKLCAGLVNREEDGILLFDVQIKRGVGESLLARSLKSFKRYIGRAVVMKNGERLDPDGEDSALGTDKPEELNTPDLVVDDNEDDEALSGEILAALQEANLTDHLHADAATTQKGVSHFLLQQQQIFRREDGQLDPVLRPDELRFTRNGEAVTIDEKFLKRVGLDGVLEITKDGVSLKGTLIKDGAIDAKAREALAAALIKAVQSTPGLAMTIANPHQDSSATMELRGNPDGTLLQLVDRRGVAGPGRLRFDRRQDVVPGLTPPRTFLDVVQEMQTASPEAFQALNDALADAFALEKAEGKIDPKLTFLQYKMQFVDMAVPGVDESGLQWHDGTGALGAEEWAFLQLKVKDLPERTQNNYYVQISWPGMKGKPIERKLDIACSGSEMAKLVSNPAAVQQKIHEALADEDWSRSGLGIAEGDRAALLKAYKSFPINVKIGFWDDTGHLSWDPSKRPALVNTMDGQDKLLPMVENVPSGVLKTLLAGEDGQTRLPDGSDVDLSDKDGLKLAQEKALTEISSTVMTTAMTSWSESSTVSMGELLKGIPDPQKVFLRQSNGVVNAVVITDENVRGAMDTLTSAEGIGDEVEALRRLLAHPATKPDAIVKSCQTTRERVRQLVKGKQLSAEEGQKLIEALGAVAKADLKKIGQVKVISEGNDTGAFGKCAPTSYFCASVCGVARSARGGFDQLKGGGKALRAASGKLEEMLTSGALTEERRLAIDAQLEEVDRLIGDMEAQRDEAREKLFASPEWAKSTEDYSTQTTEITTKQQQLLEERRRLEAGGKGDSKRAKEIKKEVQRLDQQILDLQRENTRKQQALYDTHLKAVDGEIKARRAGLDKVRRFKEAIADRMVVKTDPDDGKPYLDMRFPVPRSALDKSAGDYNGGWLIKKINALKAKPENKGRSDAEIAKELGVYYDAKKKEWMMEVRVKPEDIQEYLEQTNREDKYRGGKKHMMDFFKDPSSLNQIQLMNTLGPGLIAVGLDKGLKTMGKDSGLLYGPSGDVVASMVYNEQRVSEYQPFSAPIPDPKKDPKGYEKEFQKRRSQILDKLKRAEEDGGSMSVSMGYSSANGHVNYVVAWGTPTLDGVEVSADDIARCRMNLSENAATSSAWNNDRVQDFPINTAAMGRGIDGLLQKLRDAGKGDDHPMVSKLVAIKEKARQATAKLDAIAKKKSGSTMSAEKLAHKRQSGLNAYWAEIEEAVTRDVEALKKQLKSEGKTPEQIAKAVETQTPTFEEAAKKAAWKARSAEEKTAINSWDELKEDDDYDDALDAIRLAAGEMSDFLKDGMKLDRSSDGLKEENVLMMPSNTERDNRVSDNPEDRETVGGGKIGSQKYGSANATDAVYCVPLNCLASGLDGEITDDPDDPENKKCSASGYNYAPENGTDVPDQFVILTSMSTMLSKTARGF